MSHILHKILSGLFYCKNRLILLRILAVKKKSLKCHRGIHSHFHFTKLELFTKFQNACTTRYYPDDFKLYVASDIFFDFNYEKQIGVVNYELRYHIRKR